MAQENFDRNGAYETFVDEYSKKVEVPGDGNTYTGLALPGSLEASAVWRVYKEDANGDKKWADGDTNFDNVGTTLSGLTFTY